MNLNDLTYVVFDLETTGLKACEGNEIIEIGAVKVKNNNIISTFDELAKPLKPIPDEITKITGITNEMVSDKDHEDMVLKKFLNWLDDDNILVAHNANFDMSFVREAICRYHLDLFNYIVIDTLAISRFITPYEKYHNLTILMTRYKVDWDEDKHHRADYDALGTSKVLYKLIDELSKKNINTINELIMIPRICINKKR